MRDDAKMLYEQHIGTHIMEMSPIDGSRSPHPEGDQSTARDGLEAVGRPGRHRPPGVFAGLRGFVANAFGGQGKPTLPTSSTPPPEERRTGPNAGPDAAPDRRASKIITGCIDRISLFSKYYVGGDALFYGEVEILVDGKPLPDRRQLSDTLVGDCQVTIGLERRDTGTELALLGAVIDLALAIERETSARVMFDVEDPEVQQQLVDLWSQTFGIGQRKLPLVGPAANAPGHRRQGGACS